MFAPNECGRLSRPNPVSPLIGLLLCLVALCAGCFDFDLSDDDAPDPAPLHSLDLATVVPSTAGLLRVRGSEGEGRNGVPVTGGHDLDFDDDGRTELFVGDNFADLTGDRIRSGSGRLFYDAASLRGAPTIDLDAPPPTSASARSTA